MCVPCDLQDWRENLTRFSASVSLSYPLTGNRCVSLSQMAEFRTDQGEFSGSVMVPKYRHVSAELELVYVI